MLSQLACQSPATPKNAPDTAPINQAAPGSTSTPATSETDSAAITPPTERAAAAGWDDICHAASKAELPASDLPSAADKAKLKPGDSRRYYYGVGTATDYVRARHAAFAERESGDGAVAASTILMMLYANGLGVERNLDVAINLACTQEALARAEIEGRVLHLNSMKTPPTGKPFDFCDDVSGGTMEGYCAALAEERVDAQRQHELATLTAGWPAEHLTKLSALRAALAKFAQAHAGNERDLSAADRSTVMTEAEAGLKQRFLEALQRYEQGKLPEYSAEEARAADAELNRVYKQALGREFVDTTVTATGIKATEKIWIAYRNAWLAFGALRYPQVSPEAWMASLTRERIEQLKNL